ARGRAGREPQGGPLRPLPPRGPGGLRAVQGAAQRGRAPVRRVGAAGARALRRPRRRRAGEDGRAGPARPQTRRRHPRRAAGARVCGRAHRRRDLGTGRRDAGAPAPASQEQGVRRLLPRAVLHLRRSRGRRAAEEREAGATPARGVPRMEGCGPARRGRRGRMIFRAYYRFETGCAAYLFGCATLGKCAVVDAHEADADAYVAFAGQKGMAITHVIDTHVHADHRSDGPALASRVGARYCLHESAQVALPFEPLRDEEEIELGNTRIKVLHTPGHTPESVCLVATDLRRGADPWFVLTGDTLFVGAVGRPDRPGQAPEAP